MRAAQAGEEAESHHGAGQGETDQHMLNSVFLLQCFGSGYGWSGWIRVFCRSGSGIFKKYGTNENLYTSLICFKDFCPDINKCAKYDF